jgi:hypothetical protein
LVFTYAINQVGKCIKYHCANRCLRWLLRLSKHSKAAGKERENGKREERKREERKWEERKWEERCFDASRTLATELSKWGREGMMM